MNYAEVLSRKGVYGWAPAMPYTLGMEATGTVELLGPSVEQRAIGERVRRVVTESPREPGR